MNSNSDDFFYFELIDVVGQLEDNLIILFEIHWKGICKEGIAIIGIDYNNDIIEIDENLFGEYDSKTWPYTEEFLYSFMLWLEPFRERILLDFRR